LISALVLAVRADDGDMGKVVGWDGAERRDMEEAVERREYKRYAVNGMAEVLVADGTMLFRGWVLDISVAGCYVETRARLRLAPGTVVEMVFRVNGMVFRPLATSRVVRPGEGAGFLFMEVKGRMRAELDGLIAELSLMG
jgi:hypothetical protein